MNLINAIVHNPVKVTVGVLMTVLFGLVSLTRMPMQLTPEVQRPTITVETRWPGASPQEVEREIVLEQEEQLKSVEGITKLSSESADSKGTITLEFLVGTNMDEALLKVNSRLQQVPEYPEDADQPIISTANAADRPIAWFILSSRLPSDEKIVAFQEAHPEVKEQLEIVRNTPNPGLAMLRLRLLAEEYPAVRGGILPEKDIEVTKLRRFAEDEIEARFERVSGVSQSNVLGGLEDELQVVVDSEQLAARQLTISDVRNVLRGQNEDTSAGDFWEGKRRWVVRTLGQFRNKEEVENQLLAVSNGAPVYVRDVAEVRLGYKKPDGLVRRFGESSIAINCVRETGANVLDIMDGLREAVKDIDENILKPRGLQLVQVYDETDYIYSSVDLVKNNIFIGGALTMIVLMSFLHLGMRTLIVVPFIIVTAVAATFISPWFFAVSLALIIGSGFWFARGALVVGLAIPTSIIGTFLILGALGRSLNVISLAGLAFAVGMLVDNAVVVLENIYRRYSLGESPFQAAIKGTQEVWGAVLASTLTTIAVFLPVVFIEEEAGQLFQDIALAISAAVGLSLIVSMTLISTASARLLHKRDDQGLEDHQISSHPEDDIDQTVKKGALHRAVIGPIESGGALFVKSIVGMNAWIQKGIMRRLVVVCLLVGAAVGVSWQLWPKVEYLPTGNRNLIFCILIPPPGYNLNQLMELGESVESDLRPYWDIDPESDEAKQLNYPVIGDFFFVARGRQVFMGIRAFDSQRVAELIPLVQQAGSKLPGTFTVAKQSSLFEQGLTGGRTIEIEIIGPDLEKLVAMGGQILGKSKQMIPNAQVRPIPSLDLSSPEVHIQPKLMQAAENRVSSADLGYTANALIDGAFAGDYYLGGDKIDLTIIGQSRHIQNTQDVAALSVATPDGRLVSLGALADVEITSGPEQVNHRERQRAITIEVSPPEEMALEDAMDQIQSEIVQPMRENGQLAGGYRINLSGTADKLRDTWAALQFNVLLALMITYLLMAALFESWLYPLVIIFSVPLGAVGGILGLSILNLFMLQTLDVLTMLGFVILIGTVVNNPILIIHQSLNHINEDGMTPREAILESIRTRIRPIFMTTTTTVLGLLPLVLFPGAGSELYRGLGSVVLGGLIVSTLFTLILVPTLFSLTMDAKAWGLNLLRPGTFKRPQETAASPEVEVESKENVTV
ncbi:efflux RND transporter permease subunit [Gimesia maris]|uniref:Efflux pump membrane transporter TtgB n=1 Tax=Gimesia maris TaxID=122 RepID=A0ABX5YPZ1_9PLAN|nr:efflux RND transporter permease subunit [Gimesia maris]EDL60431.1 acriflavin resistance protein D [Gimesia maris DSM 8797]QDU15783.1 putative efflux pump membrane transporter TtgB [Gimesia maris]QEG17806.1 putative efflux pump membrane transporter TtgB [Gimesia maris]QGQ29155.1 efflux RND transporter permease subunit [Gimesia maris]